MHAKFEFIRNAIHRHKVWKICLNVRIDALLSSRHFFSHAGMLSSEDKVSSPRTQHSASSETQTMDL